MNAKVRFFPYVFSLVALVGAQFVQSGELRIERIDPLILDSVVSPPRLYEAVNVAETVAFLPTPQYWAALEAGWGDLSTALIELHPSAEFTHLLQTRLGSLGQGEAYTLTTTLAGPWQRIRDFFEKLRKKKLPKPEVPRRQLTDEQIRRQTEIRCRAQAFAWELACLTCRCGTPTSTCERTSEMIYNGCIGNAMILDNRIVECAARCLAEKAIF